MVTQICFIHYYKNILKLFKSLYDNSKKSFMNTSFWSDDVVTVCRDPRTWTGKSRNPGPTRSGTKYFLKIGPPRSEPKQLSKFQNNSETWLSLNPLPFVDNTRESLVETIFGLPLMYSWGEVLDLFHCREIKHMKPFGV